MLKQPAFRQYDDLTVFQDSDRDYVFYAIPDMPRLRYGADGRPVFEFLKYREDASQIQDGASRGGGYLEFDCELSVPQVRLDAVRGELQDFINEKYRRMHIQNPPQAQLAPPTFVDDGTASVQIITALQAKADGSGMITQIVGSGKPSLMGSNNTIVAMELTERGAKLMWEAFQMAMMPIGIVYNLKFLAQIPALTMHIWLHAGQMRHYVENINKDIDDSVWGDTDESYTRTVRDVMSKYQVAGVDITDWPSDLGSAGTDVEKFKNQMFQEGWGLLEDTLKDAMNNKLEGLKDSDKGEQGDYRHVARDMFQSFSEDMDQWITREQVVKWPTHPNGTMQGFLNTPGPNGQIPNKQDFFKEISLNDPFFQMLRVRARCNADFTNDPIHSVKLHIEYGSRAEDYLFQDSTSVQTFQEFIVPTIGNKYKYRTQVFYKNSDQTLIGSEITTDETQLVISVQDMGYLNTKFIAGSINWNMIDSAQIHVRYSDPANKVEAKEEIIQLTKEAKMADYQRLIFAPVTNPFQYQAVFILKDEQQINSGWIPETSPQVFVNDMFTDRIVVNLIPSGSFDRMAQIVVDLDYQDIAHKYQAQQTFTMTADQTAVGPWMVPLWTGATKQFRSRTMTTYKDGHTEQGDWQTKEGSQTLLVGEVFADTLKVAFLTDLIDFTQVKLVKLTLHYADAPNQMDITEDFVFTSAKRTADPWKVSIKNKAIKSYIWQATFFMIDGSRRSSASATTAEDTIVLELPA